MCIIIGFASEAFLLLGESDRRLHMLDAVRVNGYVLRFAHPACYDYANIAFTAVTASVGAVVFLSSGTDPLLLSRIQDEITVPWLRKLCSSWTKGKPGDQHDLEAVVRVCAWLRSRMKSLTKFKDFNVLDKLCNKVCNKVVPHLPNGAVVKKVLRMQGSSFRFAASSVKDDADASLIALGSSSSTFRWVSRRLKKDQSFLLRALKVAPYIYSEIDALQFFTKRATVIRVAEAVGCRILRDLPDFLLTDNEVIKAAFNVPYCCCKSHPAVDLSPILASQRDVVMKAALSEHSVSDNFWKAVDPSMLEDHVLWSVFVTKGVFNLVGTEQQRITSSHKISDDYVVKAVKSATFNMLHRGEILRAIELKTRPRLVRELYDLMMNEPLFQCAYMIYKFMKLEDCDVEGMLTFAKGLGELEKLENIPMTIKVREMPIIRRAACVYGYNDLAAFREVLSLDWK